MLTGGGVLNVIQVITELTPQYARVEALQVTWDMRIATSTLSDETLDKILMHQINPKNLEHRKKIVRFYLQCKRYSMAVAALQKILDDFKNDTQVAQDLQPTLQKLRLMYAQQMLDELGLRQGSGQHALVQKILEKFPTEDVSGEILQTVRQVQRQYKEFEAKRKAIDAACQAFAVAGPTSVPTARRWRGAGRDRGGVETRNAAPHGGLPAEPERHEAQGRGEALPWPSAAGCWGSDAASTDLPATESAWRLRGLVQNYLTETGKVKRDRQLLSILSEKAAKPELLAALAAHMKPPYPLPELIDKDIPGYSKLEVGVHPRPAGCGLLRAVAAGVQSRSAATR